MVHRKMGWSLAILGLALILVSTACGGARASDYQIISPASLSAGSPIPSPGEKVVLTITGDIAYKNAGDALEFDMPTLERLGLVEYSVLDPWANVQVSYSGILVSDLVEFAGAPDSAGEIRMMALDDYQADITLEDIRRWPILLATRANGQYMTIENSGPTRIIFPYDTYSEIDSVRYNDLWVWNVKSMNVQ